MKKYIFLLAFLASFGAIAQSITTNPISYPKTGHLQAGRYYSVKQVQAAVDVAKTSEISLFSNFFIPDGSTKSQLPLILTLDTLKAAGVFGSQTVAKKTYSAQLNLYGNSIFVGTQYQNDFTGVQWTKVAVGEYYSPFPTPNVALIPTFQDFIPSRKTHFYSGSGTGGVGWHLNTYFLINGAYELSDYDTGIIIKLEEL